MFPMDDPTSPPLIGPSTIVVVNDARHQLQPEFLQRTTPYFFDVDSITQQYKWAKVTCDSSFPTVCMYALVGVCCALFARASSFRGRCGSRRSVVTSMPEMWWVDCMVVSESKQTCVLKFPSVFFLLLGLNGVRGRWLSYKPRNGSGKIYRTTLWETTLRHR